MSDPFRKVKPGDPGGIPAIAYNEFIDTALERRRRPRSSSGAVGLGADPAFIRVKNNTGGNLPALSVLGLSDMIIDPTLNLDGFKLRVALLARKPIVPQDLGRFAITMQPIAISEMGWALIDGACAVQVQVVNEADSFADVTDTVTDKLTSNPTSGAQILWKPTGTGLKWAYVRLTGAGGAESVGEHQYMTHQVVAHRVGGWDFDLLHPPVE